MYDIKYAFSHVYESRLTFSLLLTSVLAVTVSNLIVETV